MKRALVFMLLAAAAAAAPALPGPSAPTARSLAGWNDLRWGMTAADVLKRHPDARPIAEMFAPPPTPDPRMGEYGRKISGLFEEANRLVLDDPTNAGALYFKTSILDRLFTVTIRFRSGRLTSVTLVGRSPDPGMTKEVTRTLTAKYGGPAGDNDGVTEWRLPKTRIEMTATTETGDEKFPVVSAVKLVYSDATGGNPKGNL